MLLALASIALADAAIAAPEDCGMTEIAVTSPAPLATGVPIDVVPAALITEGACGSESWVGTLLDAGTGEEVASVTHAIADGRLIEVDPGHDLSPDTTYTLQFSPSDGGGEVTEIGFTTGSDTAAGLTGAPTVESADVVFNTEGFTLLQVEVGAVPSADGATIAAFGLEGEEELAWTSVTGPTVVRLDATSFAFAEAPEEVCVTARQRDLAGVWSESAPECVAPEIVRGSSGGCLNVTRGAPMGGLFGVLLAVSLARRSGRGSGRR